jgi:hypothetical protein
VADLQVTADEISGEEPLVVIVMATHKNKKGLIAQAFFVSDSLC